MLKNFGALALLAVLAFAPAARSQAKSSTASAAANAMFTKLDHKWMDAERTRDFPYLEKFFAPSYVLVLVGGKMLTKDQWLGVLRGPDHPTIEVLNPQDVKVHLYKNVAILTDHTTIRGHDSNGKSMNGEYIVFRVLIKQNGAWRATGVVMNPMQTK